MRLTAFMRADASSIGEAGGDRQAPGVDAVGRAGDATGLDRQAELGAERLGEARDRHGSAGEDDALDAASARPERVWKSSELRTSTAMRRTPSCRTRRASLTIASSPSIVLDGGAEPDVVEPGAGVLERQRPALGELDGERLDAAADDAGEEAAARRSATARLVTPPTERYMTRLVGPRAVQRADHREGGEVDALGPQAGGARGGEQPCRPCRGGRRRAARAGAAPRPSRRCPSGW